MAEDRSPILRATSPMLISAIENLLDLKFGSTRTVHQCVRQARAGSLALARVTPAFPVEAEVQGREQKDIANEIRPRSHLHRLHVLRTYLKIAKRSRSAINVG